MKPLIVDEARSSTSPAEGIAPLRLPSETRVLGGRYRLRGQIGRGGMADVYLGDDLTLARTVAIKVLHRDTATDPSELERFQREAIALAAVTSPHVVSIYDLRVEGEIAYLVMQSIDGQTIEDDIESTGPMSPGRARTVLGRLLDGLAEVRSRGLIHRDIKPANVLLDEQDHVVLVDLGTPGYLAPEPHAEPTSDVYQVGLLMLFLLTGVDAGRRSRPPRFDDLFAQLPAAVARVARRALAADPAARFPSTDEMKQAVEAVLRSSTIDVCCNADTPQVRPQGTGRDQPLTAEIGPLLLHALLVKTSLADLGGEPPTQQDLRPEAQIFYARPSGARRALHGALGTQPRLEVIKPLEPDDVRSDEGCSSGAAPATSLRLGVMGSSPSRLHRSSG